VLRPFVCGRGDQQLLARPRTFNALTPARRANHGEPAREVVEHLVLDSGACARGTNADACRRERLVNVRHHALDAHAGQRAEAPHVGRADGPDDAKGGLRPAGTDLRQHVVREEPSRIVILQRAHVADERDLAGVPFGLQPRCGVRRIDSVRHHEHAIAGFAAVGEQERLVDLRGQRDHVERLDDAALVGAHARRFERVDPTAQVEVAGITSAFVNERQ
jgi:hypothetical protein